MIADRYRLERKVGGGRVAAVWRVHDEVTEGPCAIKLLHRSMHKHPEALTRFALEERLARELTGPYFPERVGSGVWDGVRYIAWRWHQGESLRSLFERNPKQDAPTVYSIVQETCQALSVVHAAGYAHGDLKPENLFFADRGQNDSLRQLKLMSFGVASRLSRPAFERVSGRRKPGEIVGTPLYLSPDLILGRVPKAGQADLWALAVIVYEALTGRAPFLGDDVSGVLAAILERQAPKPSSVADHLPGTIDLWWAQALEQEFATPDELATSLARALAPVLRTSHTQRSASLPERLPPASEVLTPLSAPVAAGPSPASITAAGLGQAKVSSIPPPQVVSPLGIEPEPRRPEPLPSSTFAPLPTPLRDFASAGSRKTLVGISAPVSLPPIALPAVTSVVKAPSLALTPGIAMEAIEGTPIKPIDVLSPAAPPKVASAPVDGVRRPAHPTVPFPRPRFLPRSAAAMDADAEESPDIEQPAPRSWQDRSPRTLRFVLTSPDHKPQRIAAVVVCAAAALVIFIVGRSPIAGTAAIGQTTGSLSAERSPAEPAAPSRGPGDEDAADDAEGTSAPPSASVAELSTGEGPLPADAPLAGKELAPGLVMPPPSKGPSSPREIGSRSRPRSSESHPPSPAAPATRQGSGANGEKESASGLRSSPPKAPPPRSAPLPRKPSGEIDFGI